MVPIPTNQGLHIPHVHLIEIPVLVPAQDAHLIQDGVERRAVRVVRGPPPVAADRAECVGTEDIDAVRDGAADGPEVGVV